MVVFQNTFCLILFLGNVLLALYSGVMSYLNMVDFVWVNIANFLYEKLFLEEQNLLKQHKLSQVKGSMKAPKKCLFFYFKKNFFILCLFFSHYLALKLFLLMNEIIHLTVSYIRPAPLRMNV